MYQPRRPFYVYNTYCLTQILVNRGIRTSTYVVRQKRNRPDQIGRSYYSYYYCVLNNYLQVFLAKVFSTTSYIEG